MLKIVNLLTRVEWLSNVVYKNKINILLSDRYIQWHS